MLRSRVRASAAALIVLTASLLFGCSGSDVAGADTWASLTIRNDSNITICYVYVTPSDVNTWGSDRLGNQTIPPGFEVTVFQIDPGANDLRAEDCGGAWEAESYGVDFGPGEDVIWTIS